MKSLLIVSKTIMAIFAVLLFAGAVSAGTGWDINIVAPVVGALSFIPTGAGIAAFAGINQEIWTPLLVEQFRAAEEAGFLTEIPDESRFVIAGRGENEVINLTDIGADPEVLINNTTYPIGFYTQTDTPIAITLNKYQTKATKVTDDEIQFIAYDKIKLVQTKHTKAIIETRNAMSIHALAPTANATNTPVIKTTGADDGTGRKKLIPADILRLKRAWDALGIPAMGRILVLSTDHHNDLLDWDTAKDTARYSADDTGKLNNLIYGFKAYVYIENPYFNTQTSQKLAFGATVTATDHRASVAFSAQEMFRAAGSTKIYTNLPDTQNQAWMFNVRHNYIVLPKKERAYSAIMSDAV